MRRLVATLLAGAALLGACAEDRPASGPHLRAGSHETMGSLVTITVWTDDDRAADAAMPKAFAEFDRLDALLSVWKPGSDVVRINAAAGRAPVAVGRELIEVLSVARQVSEWTQGKFDVTFGALAEVWKFDHDQDNRVPTRAEIETRLPHVDYTAVRIDDGASTVFLAREGVRVHLGGIGKGYAVERAVAILRAAGFSDFMVQAGGDLFVSGQPGPTSWRLGIQDPRGAADDSFATIDLRDATLSTSGDYERYFVKDGRRYHHLIDPDLGEPAQGAVSVTIVAKSPTLADGLSTGVFLLGPDAGMALVERLPDVEAVIVTAAQEVKISSGLQGRVQLRHAPRASP